MKGCHRYGHLWGAKLFTLVELLVVVAIVMMLIAILAPALSKAKEKAVQIKCASQVRQLSAFMAMYQSDRNGFLPYAPGGQSQYLRQRVSGASSGTREWVGVGLLYGEGYVANPQLLYCPSLDTMYAYKDNWKLNASDWISGSYIYGFSDSCDWYYTVADRRGLGANLRKPLLWDLQTQWSYKQNHKGGCNVLYFNMAVKFKPGIIVNWQSLAE